MIKYSFFFYIKYKILKLFRFKYKVNEISEKEIREMKGVINNIRGHHWDNGSKNGSYTTTNNQFLQYDSTKAKYSSIPLSNEYKDCLRSSHFDIGKGIVPLSSTHVTSYIPNQNIQKTTYNQNLKKSSIEFNPKQTNIKGNSVYTTDYTVKENLE